MATLTDEQTDFLKSHHIPLDKTFDASGLSSKEYKAKMKENGTLVAYGVPPCPKGHTLKNKQANCLQCNPQAIASIKRQATAGDVYIAVSPSQLVSKIAVLEDATDIVNRLNAQNHAAINDWQLVLTGRTDSIGQMENHLQQRLASRQLAKKLTPKSKTTKASNIYDIDIHEAIDILNDQSFKLITIDNSVIDNYHNLYTQQENERQLELVKLAEANALEKQANAKAVADRKQAELEAQQREQQALKEQKLAQKRLRQQQNAAKKQQTQQKQSLYSEPSLVKNPNNSASHTTKPAFELDHQQRHLLIIFGVCALMALAFILFALFKR